MENFTFNNTTKIIFGKDTVKQVGSEILNHGKKVLLHYGGGSIKKSGLYDSIIKSLDESNVDYVELGGVLPNPRLKLVNEGIELCKQNDVDIILAVGGGSVIDSAKAIAMGVKYDGDVWDFYTGKNLPKYALPVATILTIPAAGSESSPASVITKEEGMLKRAINHELLYPVFSILNPELAFTLPKSQVANGVTDIMAHLMERYFTNVKHVELTDRLIEATLKTVINNAPHILKNNENYDAWAEIMWSGTVAHNNLLNTGRIGDWASHAIEHELSGIYDIAHGAGLAIVFPAWMKYVYKHDTERFVQFANRVWDIDCSSDNSEKIAIEGINQLELFFKQIGQKIKLSELDIGDDKIEEMSTKCTDSDKHTVGQFVKLKSYDVHKILELAR